MNAPLMNLEPDVKAFIYQALLEFEPFTTDQTVINVVSKDAPAGQYCIGISIADSGGQLEAEASDADVYTAIGLAKTKLLQTLIDIQNDVISNQDRQMQIKHALTPGGNTLH